MPFMTEPRRLLPGSPDNKENGGEEGENTAQGKHNIKTRRI